MSEKQIPLHPDAPKASGVNRFWAMALLVGFAGSAGGLVLWNISRGGSADAQVPSAVRSDGWGDTKLADGYRYVPETEPEPEPEEPKEPPKPAPPAPRSRKVLWGKDGSDTGDQFKDPNIAIAANDVAVWSGQAAAPELERRGCKLSAGEIIETQQRGGVLSVPLPVYGHDEAGLTCLAIRPGATLNLESHENDSYCSTELRQINGEAISLDCWPLVGTDGNSSERARIYSIRVAGDTYVGERL